MAAGEPTTAKTTWARLRAALPEGLELPRATWESRHRVVLVVLTAHALALPVFGYLQGWGMAYVIGEGALLGLLAWIASRQSLGRRFRSSIAALGCVTSSAVLTQFSGGYIEAHFHFFVIVALVAMYQDWVPFLLAIVYVAVDHGVVGSLAPEWVYNHPDGIAHPWKWALIHAVMVLAECAALLAFWASAEESRARSDLFLKSAGDGILGLDLDGYVTFANPAAAELLGRPPDALVGESVESWMPTWLPNGNLGKPGEGQLLRAGGPSVPVEWLLTPTIKSGLTVGYVLTVKDIGRRLEAEANRRKVETLLEQDRFKTACSSARASSNSTAAASGAKPTSRWARSSASRSRS
ncbi:MAG TPA: PAS domain-containing protein [Candidatus Thermoplasmatota archaeon]|nr:PAS domain-containing protein [Candidatus Thermoplasmatota archaeon]